MAVSFLTTFKNSTVPSSNKRLRPTEIVVYAPDGRYVAGQLRVVKVESDGSLTTLEEGVAAGYTVNVVSQQATGSPFYVANVSLGSDADADAVYRIWRTSQLPDVTYQDGGEDQRLAAVERSLESLIEDATERNTILEILRQERANGLSLLLNRLFAFMHDVQRQLDQTVKVSYIDDGEEKGTQDVLLASSSGDTVLLGLRDGIPVEVSSTAANIEANLADLRTRLERAFVDERIRGRLLTLIRDNGSTEGVNLGWRTLEFVVYVRGATQPATPATFVASIRDGVDTYGDAERGTFNIATNVFIGPTTNSAYSTPIQALINIEPHAVEGQTIYASRVVINETADTVQIIYSPFSSAGLTGITQTQAVALFNQLLDTELRNNNMAFRALLNTMYDPDGDPTTAAITESQAQALTPNDVEQNTTANGLLAVAGAILREAKEVEDRIEALGEPQDINFRIAASGGGGGGGDGVTRIYSKIDAVASGLNYLTIANDFENDLVKVTAMDSSNSNRPTLLFKKDNIAVRFFISLENTSADTTANFGEFSGFFGRLIRKGASFPGSEDNLRNEFNPSNRARNTLVPTDAGTIANAGLRLAPTAQAPMGENSATDVMLLTKRVDQGDRITGLFLLAQNLSTTITVSFNSSIECWE